MYAQNTSERNTSTQWSTLHIRFGRTQMLFTEPPAHNEAVHISHAQKTDERSDGNQKNTNACIHQNTLFFASKLDEVLSLKNILHVYLLIENAGLFSGLLAAS